MSSNSKRKRIEQLFEEDQELGWRTKCKSYSVLEKEVIANQAIEKGLHGVKYVSNKYKIPERTIRSWVSALQNQLHMQDKPGRPKLLDPQDVEEIKEQVKQHVINQDAMLESEFVELLNVTAQTSLKRKRCSNGNEEMSNSSIKRFKKQIQIKQVIGQRKS